jgi:hypothetical protein
VASDTGIVMRTHTVSAPGLGITTCGAADLADAEARIGGETGADVVMAVRLRVGTYHKEAALEKDSAIRWTAATGATTLTAHQALLLDGEVTDSSRFIPVAGRIEPVLQDEFVRELGEILPTFIGLAFPSLNARVVGGKPPLR